jgi:hypothetical protein
MCLNCLSEEIAERYFLINSDWIQQISYIFALSRIRAFIRAPVFSRISVGAFLSTPNRLLTANSQATPKQHPKVEDRFRFFHK